MPTDVPDDDAIVPAAALEPSSDLVAQVVTYDDRPAECTIYPPAEHVTTWITAREGSFAALAAMR